MSSATVEKPRRRGGASPEQPRKSVYRYLATSDGTIPRFIRGLRRLVTRFTLPAPRALVLPWLSVVLAYRAAYCFCMRVFICEPLFKAYCKHYGHGVRTGEFLHWIEGRGDIILGDNVRLDGKCSITFAARYSDNPTLQVGSNTNINHNVTFVIGKKIAIGNYCRIAASVVMFDSSGHPADPALRMSGASADPDKVRPITIEDNVWIGRQSIILPGVTIGEGSVVSSGSVVRKDVAPYTIVAGNPAVQVSTLTPPQK